jgi:hypothetical protein
MKYVVSVVLIAVFGAACYYGAPIDYSAKFAADKRATLLQECYEAARRIPSTGRPGELTGYLSDCDAANNFGR